MKSPLIHRIRRSHDRERGVTMALVAIAMIAIIAIAALSVDLVTLFLAREEAQRSADAGALAAARVISLAGLTGDTNNSSNTWACICGASCPSGSQVLATTSAQAAAGQSTIQGVGGNSFSIFTVSVNYSDGGTSNPDCTTLSGTAFGVNPIVTVQVTRTSLPTFFSRIWSRAGNAVSASATAEVFNPSFTLTGGVQATGTIIPVQPRCVKPWIVANQDPLYPQPGGSGYCRGTACTQFVDPTTGAINHPGVSLNGTGATGVIGEQFLLIPDCYHMPRGFCSVRDSLNFANVPVSATGVDYIPTQPNLDYLPGLAVNQPVAVPSVASAGNLFEQAIAGCDQTTVYQCGVQSSSASNPNMAGFSENPAHPTGDGDTVKGVLALIHEGAPSIAGSPSDGQDYFSTYGQFGSAPYQILAGSSNPLVNATSFPGGSPLSASNSIVTVPIFDSSTALSATAGNVPVTIVGFLQVFINGVDQYGNVDVTVLNVAGCGNGTNPVSANAVTGTSPVPVRLITPPVPSTP